MKKHLAKIMRLTDALDDLDLSYRAVASREVIEKVEPLHNAEAIFSNTSKLFYRYRCSECKTIDPDGRGGVRQL